MFIGMFAGIGIQGCRDSEPVATTQSMVCYQAARDGRDSPLKYTRKNAKTTALALIGAALRAGSSLLRTQSLCISKRAWLIDDKKPSSFYESTVVGKRSLRVCSM